MRGKSLMRAAYLAVKPAGGFDPSSIGTVDDNGLVTPSVDTASAEAEGGVDDQIELCQIEGEALEEPLLLICWCVRDSNTDTDTAHHQ